MTWQLLHSEFPYKWGKFEFLFSQCNKFSWFSYIFNQMIALSQQAVSAATIRKESLQAVWNLGEIPCCVLQGGNVHYCKRPAMTSQTFGLEKETKLFPFCFFYRSSCYLFYRNCHRGPVSRVQTPAYKSTAKSNPRAEFAEKQSVRAPSYVIYPYFWLVKPEWKSFSLELQPKRMFL